MELQMDQKKDGKRKNFLQLLNSDIDPDKELLLWEHWVQVRKTETEHLASMLDRTPADLTMNLLENIREDKERKTALEYSQIDPKPTIRGGPWEQPLRLKQPCYCKPVYEIKGTSAEQGNPPIVEHIGVPKYIQENEKGLTGKPRRKIFQKIDAEYVKYREKRELQLNENIKKIDPFRPDISELIVRGFKPKPPTKKLPPLPRINFIEYQSENDVTSVYAVQINKTIFYKYIPDQSNTLLGKIKNESWHENCTSWTYYFNVPVNKAGRCKLFLQNLGTVTLRFCWKKLKKNIPYIPEETYNQTFFFNNNEDVISPGQKKEIFFTFVSSQPGIYSESWELKFCNICFFDTLADKLVVNLNADSVEDFRSAHKNSKNLKLRINRKASTNVVSSILFDLITKATVVEPQIYPYKKLFLEEEMFLMKNPVCFYHQTEVMKMNDVFTEMAPGLKWDLSIVSWREKMMTKDYENRMTYYEVLKKSHATLLKPWHEKEKVIEQKHRAVKYLLRTLADKFDREYERLLNLCGMRKLSQKNTGSFESYTSDNLNLKKVDTMRNLFYLFAYEHVANSIEACAGILSSIDLNRWIEFDFCRT